jgi:hypothetical protein
VIAVRRLTSVIVVVAVAVATQAAIALGHDGVGERTSVQFQMSSDTCSKLPRGTTLTASGHQRAVTKTLTDPSGVQTVVNITRSRGIATSNGGLRYAFDYRNSFAVSNTAANPAQYTGTMFDTFELTRHGRTTLSNGFVAVYTTDLAQLNTYAPLYAFGDPIDFTAGTSRCDPL